MRSFWIRVFALVVTVFGGAAIASASPIAYSITSTASGLLNGTAFSSAQVTVTLSGDTAGIAPIFGGLFLANPGTTTVDIAGLGTATVLNPTAIWATEIPVQVAGPAFPLLPYIVIGKLDSPPALDSITGIAFYGSAALAGFDLKTPFGPAAGGPGGVGYPVGMFLQTDKGLLSFGSNFSPTTVGGATVKVPEPVSLLLLGSGLVAIASRFRRRVRG